MKRLLTLLASLVAATTMALVVVPLALGTPLNGNKPTTSSVCPNDKQYGNPIFVSSIGDPDARAAAALSDVNQDGYVCANSVSDKSNGVGPGVSYIDNTAHNQNG